MFSVNYRNSQGVYYTLSVDYYYVKNRTGYILTMITNDPLTKIAKESKRKFSSQIDLLNSMSFIISMEKPDMNWMKRNVEFKGNKDLAERLTKNLIRKIQVNQ